MLLPALQLLDQIVVTLGNLAKFRVHTSLEVDEVLPSLQSITGVLVSLPNNLVQVSHGDLGHQRLLNGATKDGLDARVSALLM